jgi:hypothetical protein
VWKFGGFSRGAMRSRCSVTPARGIDDGAPSPGPTGVHPESTHRVREHRIESAPPVRTAMSMTGRARRTHRRDASPPPVEIMPFGDIVSFRNVPGGRIGTGDQHTIAFLAGRLDYHAGGESAATVAPCPPP